MPGERGCAPARKCGRAGRADDPGRDALRPRRAVHAYRRQDRADRPVAAVRPAAPGRQLLDTSHARRGSGRDGPRGGAGRSGWPAERDARHLARRPFRHLCGLRGQKLPGGRRLCDDGQARAGQLERTPARAGRGGPADLRAIRHGIRQGGRLAGRHPPPGRALPARQEQRAPRQPAHALCGHVGGASSWTCSGVERAGQSRQSGQSGADLHPGRFAGGAPQLPLGRGLCPARPDHSRDPHGRCRRHAHQGPRQSRARGRDPSVQRQRIHPPRPGQLAGHADCTG